jgi:uncharacterized protein YjiS (DUF1127 family)
MAMNDVALGTLPGISPLRTLRANFADWRRRRAIFWETYRELDMMSDRELADLRMCRADFYHLAKSKAEAAV